MIHGPEEALALQRLFSTFPGGWPGLGLFLLRLAPSSVAFAQGAGYLLSTGAATPRSWLVGAAGIVVGVSLLIGFLTPVASSIVALGNILMIFYRFPLMPHDSPGAKLLVIDVIVVALAVAFLGPGAFSLDARLFGRREIIIPDAPRLPRP
jgi:uncharacterized membrane protein YphA (DoxX/SURF4 family)